MSEFSNWTHLAEKAAEIDNDLYVKYDVKRGLRNADHTGVLVGLSNIGSVSGVKKVDGVNVPAEGKLTYRGIDIKDLAEGYLAEKRVGYEETAYLLLFGKLPTRDELEQFSEYLKEQRKLPEYFTKDIILSFRGKDIMNMLARSVLALYTTDDNADDTSTENVLRQSISLIAKFPEIIAHAFHGMRYHYLNKSLVIRHPHSGLGHAENFLYMLKGATRYTPLEVEILDLALVLHAEHEGGNNSSFTVHVVSSSQTDTYSAIAAAIGSLKGPLHGGANSEVMAMMDNIKRNVKDWGNDQEIEEYLRKILRKEVYDRSGKIYGMGHAVYTVSDPRAVVLKKKAREVAIEKDRLHEFNLYDAIERLAPKVFAEIKGEKVISPNVDFYSGFVYCMLDIPVAVYTPLFAMARIAGWCAHRLEELISAKRIIRPAYKTLAEEAPYIPLNERG
ncbi:citrate/2-methylcitrate synthase [uncultured Acetobacteroides sp.]|uniref:citrate/2-methylcitrate synthase n=1 Tax=uncultured Acetobacteroides sp. TaxID=1760811 RepID=UPI0029F4831C|nr:citrate/2-methylcitrate synthase [uncultured Acetobacteroides sp.]